MTTLAGIRSIEELEIERLRVFVRVDFNVPLDKQGRVTDDERIRASLDTIRHAMQRGAKVVLASHLGRPKGADPALSLEPVGARLSEITGWEVHLPDDCVGDAAKKVIADLRENQVCLLENLRFHPGEEKNDDAFARELNKLCDVYVNDAFGAAHRAHASVDALPRMMQQRGVGFLMQRELASLDKILASPERPFVTILGGAKVSDKIGVIEALLDRADTLCIGGAMANTLLAARGADLKASKVEKDTLSHARSLLEKARARGVDVVLPVDLVVASGPDATVGETVSSGAVPDGTMALDIGPATVAAFSGHIARAKTIFWNGPLGLFENPVFASGTFGVARALAESPGFSIVGGGDSAAAVRQAGAGVAEKIGFISTGGGAALELLEGKRLPGVEALRGRS
jgi:phosphoglycerate kinase